MTFSKLIQLLLETPIGNFETKGNWNLDAPRYGYDKPSIKMITRENYVEKVRAKWGKIDQIVDMYLLRSKEGNKYSEIGEVSPEFVKTQLKLDIPLNEDRITIIFSNNKGDEKIPLTPWMLAHRFAHALAPRHATVRIANQDREYQNPDWKNLREQVDYIIKWVGTNVYKTNMRGDQQYYDSQRYTHVPINIEPKKIKIAEALGTFKSARDKNIRASFEMTNECIAQYIIDGSVKLNRELPRRLVLKKAWGRDGDSLWMSKDITPEQIADALSNAEATIEGYVQELLTNATGRIFVM